MPHGARPDLQPGARALVVGGGVAGWAAARALARAGLEVELHERSAVGGPAGHALLLMDNGLDALAQLGLLGEVARQGSWIGRAEVRCARQTRWEALGRCLALSRSALVQALEHAPGVSYRAGSELVGLDVERGSGALLARFSGGVERRADLLVGADGVRSLVRADVCPSMELRPGRVQELVSLVPTPRPPARHLIKQHMPDLGLAVGMAPVGPGQAVVWVQFDVARWTHGASNSEMLLRRLLPHLPGSIAAALRGGSAVHWWRTCDARPAGRLHSAGAVLVGDAAHPFLPFTSQGANCALADALRLARMLREERQLESALIRYSVETLNEARHHHDAGRTLEENFLRGQMSSLPRSSCQQSA